MNISLVFSKYFQDLDILGRMKGAKEYHVFHLGEIGMLDLVGYRYIAKFLKDPYVRLFNIDETFLNVVKKMIENVREHK